MNLDIKEWLRYAENDLKLAKMALNADIYEYACFHAQQAVEKLLKTLILFHGREIPRTHSIKVLIDILKNIDKSYNYLFDLNADELSFYAVLTRYPEFEKDINSSEAKEAIEIGEKVKEFVMKKLDLS